MNYPAYNNWGQGMSTTIPNASYGSYALPQVYPNVPQSVQAPSAQAQSGGLILVSGDDEVNNYPVAPGYSLSFIDNSFSHLWIKTAGLTQLEQPRVDKYGLSRDGSAKKEAKEPTEYALKSDLDKLWTEFKKFRSKGGETK